MTQPRKRTQTHTDDTAKEKDTDTSVLMILPRKRTQTHTDDTAKEKDTDKPMTAKEKDTNTYR